MGAMQDMTVVAVVTAGPPSTVDAHILDADAVHTSAALAEAMAVAAPVAGELDTGTTPANLRERGLSQNTSVATSMLSDDDFDRIASMGGSNVREVFSEDYSAVAGWVVPLDVMVGTSSDGRPVVDFSTAVPHPTTDPLSIEWDEPIVRADGITLDPAALATGAHTPVLFSDDSWRPVNEHNQVVCSPEQRMLEQYAAADRSGVPHRGPVLITVYDAQIGGEALGRAETLEAGCARGSIADPAQMQTSLSWMDTEAVLGAAGANSAPIYDASGERIGAMHIVEADYGAERAGSGLLVDPLSASACPDYGLAPGVAGTQLALASGPGGLTAQHMPSLPAAGLLGASGRASGGAVAPASLQGVAEPVAAPGRLAGTRDAVRKHGPAAMDLLRKTANDHPELTAKAKGVAVNSTAALLATKSPSAALALKKAGDQWSM